MKNLQPVFKKNLFSTLIVDDNSDVRTSLKHLLSIYDIHCTLAEDGQQALDYLKKQRFDLLLLDIEMPEINGFQVISEIQKYYSDTDIIILSGKASFEYAQQALREGVSDFIDKPFKPSELINSIHKVANKRDLKKQQNKLSANHTSRSFNNTLTELESIIHNTDLELTRSIINSSPAVAFLWINSPGWPVHFVSSNVLDLLGYSENDFISRKVVYFDLIHPDDKERVISEVATDNDTTTFKHKPYRMQSKSGEIKWIDDCTSCVRNELRNITHYQSIIIDVTERELVHQDLKNNQMILEHSAQHDPLTGLPNRLLLMDRLQQLIKSNLREKKQFAVFYIDLDKFKVINDSLGHDAGDKVLSIVAKRLRKNIRAIDTIARIGGDEFILLMEAVNNKNDIRLMAEKIITSVKKPIHCKKHMCFVTLSIGISLSSNNTANAEDLLKKADIAMYQAKKKGRDQFMFYQT